MTTDCTARQLVFQGWGEGRRREVRLDFEGGLLSSDGGSLLLAETERRRQILSRLAGCFVDHRDPDLVEHEVISLVSQRVFALALGYEDINDHEQLRSDPLLAAVVGVSDPSGGKRRRVRDTGKPLAGKSTLNRFEHGAVSDAAADRYKRIEAQPEAIEDLLIDLFVESQPRSSKRFILDLDATDDPVHGEQEGRFYHGYYGHYCFLPLYIACGDSILWAELRPSNIDAWKGSVEALTRIVARIRKRFPRVEILIRADSAFAREKLMSWCEANGVEYVLGLARNRRLERSIQKELARAGRKHARTKRAERCFKDFTYATRSTWRRKRRVIGKAEVLAKG
ncbi:MAG: IS1380 family transposase, partial [Thermoanaerobaculia bacterium]